MNNNELILVDLYNTLIRNTNRLSPYKYLYQAIKKENPYITFNSRDFFNYSMKKNLTINGLIQFFDVKISKESINEFKYLIKQEMNSIIYNDELISELNSYNVPICLVSNLSKEYSTPLNELSKKIKFEKIYLSYELNALKPDKKMFNIIYEDYKKIPLEKIIIIGDGLINEGEFAKTNDINFRHIPEWY